MTSALPFRERFTSVPSLFMRVIYLTPIVEVLPKMHAFRNHKRNTSIKSRIVSPCNIFKWYHGIQCKPSLGEKMKRSDSVV